MMNHSEMTAHIRKRIKASGIKARVRKSVVSGVFGAGGIQIMTPSYDVKFSGEESREIAFICDCNRLTGVRGDPIDVSLNAKLSGREQIDFYMPKAA
jgi:hypothetical protein